MLFGLVVVLCLAFIIWGRSKRNNSSEQLEALQRRMQFSQSGPIPPSAGALNSLKDANASLRSLNREMDRKLFAGESGRRLPFSGDSTAAYFELASFAEENTRRLRDAGIQFREGERFGFQQFEQEGPDAAILQGVMSQKACADALLEILVQSKPVALDHIYRENLAAGEASVLQRAAGSGSNRRTRPSDTIDVREESRILNGYSFEVSFEGYTESLRRFLKSSRVAPIPILVSSLRVEPLDRFETGDEKKTSASSVNPFEVLADANAGAEGPVPIIRNNLSRFHLKLVIYLGEEVATKS